MVIMRNRCVSGVVAILNGNLIVIDADENRYESPINGILVSKAKYRLRLWLMIITMHKLFHVHMPRTDDFILGFVSWRVDMWKKPLSITA